MTIIGIVIIIKFDVTGNMLPVPYRGKGSLGVPSTFQRKERIGKNELARSVKMGFCTACIDRCLCDWLRQETDGSVEHCRVDAGRRTSGTSGGTRSETDGD
jgi:hypothetical protein